jgi:SAM-dependent methyltransferase
MRLNWRRGNLPVGSGRALERELLECAGPQSADRNLRDIARINRWFGGHDALLRILRGFVSPDERFSLLDVGAGSGDMGRCITRHFRNAKVVSLDHREFHLRDAASPRVVADALQLPFSKQAFDFVLCSSVLHHFPDFEVVKMIASLRHFAQRALLLLDLERHPLAHRFLPITRRIFGWSPLTLHDGPVSVAAAFRLEELLSLAAAAGATAVVGRKHRPWFRLSVIVPAHAPEFPPQEIAHVESDSHAVILRSTSG